MILTKPIQFFEEQDDSKGAVESEETKPKSLEEFSKKFSASNKAAPSLGGDATSDENKKVIEKQVAEGEADEELKTEDKVKGEEIKEKLAEKTKKPFIKQQ